MAAGHGVGTSAPTNKARGRRSWWRSFWVRFILMGILMVLICGVLGYGVVMLVLEKYRRDADEFKLEDVNNLDHPSLILDCKGREIGRIYDENRSYVTLDKISHCMIDALVAQEDKNFWEHEGYDIMGILRAAWEAGFNPGRANQGASTITQQLARNAYDLEQRTLAKGGSKYERKLVEIFLAIRLEKRYTKKQILEFYLNRIYFGRGYYGIRAASLGYFGKEPRDLTVQEAASLAALVKNPENYNPVKNAQLNLRWRNDVIGRMERLGMITSLEAQRIKSQPLELHPAPIRRHTSYLHALVQKEVIGLFDDPIRGDNYVKSRGLRIYTTIDADLQNAASLALQQQLRNVENRADYRHIRHDAPHDPRTDRHEYLDGAIYAVDNRSGATRIYVGGRDFERDNFDLIGDGRRPMGTALLPFLYMCAFDNGWSPCSYLVDDAMDNRLAGIGGTKGILGEWGMEVTKGRYMGSITVRQALEWSKIAAAARLGMAIAARSQRGAKPFVDTLLHVGITPPPRNPGSVEAHPEYYPRVYLGTEPISLQEMTMAYTVIPNLGKRAVKPYIIVKVEESDGRVLWENPLHTNGKAVNSTTPCTAYRIHSILHDSLNAGSALRIKPYLPAQFNGGVKSGTNYDFADVSMFAYTSSLTCGIWVGYLNDRHAIYPEAFATDICGPILADILKRASENYADKPINPPADVDAVEICKYSGQRATNFCYERTTDTQAYKRPTYVEYFPKGDVSLVSCGVHGDSGPSLDELMDTRQYTTSSRILPIAPILPKGLALIGDDPYGCTQELNPQYRDTLEDTELTHPGTVSDELQADETEEAEETRNTDSRIDLRIPAPLRHFPLDPLPL